MPALHPTTKPLELSIVALGVARLKMPELDAIRKQSLPIFSSSLCPQLLKHSDEQTLSSLAALSEAMHDFDLVGHDFSRWAVVSSSKYLGRSAFAAVIHKYQKEGPWGVSVQVIPHRTPHAVSGTISLALQTHGPCIGAGGNGDESDALISVACMLRERPWQGVWLVSSAWSPELLIDPTGTPTSESTCLASALAVVSQPSADAIGQIRFSGKTLAQAHTADAACRGATGPSLTEYLAGERFLAGESHDRAGWSCTAGNTLRIDVELQTAPERRPAGPLHNGGRARHGLSTSSTAVRVPS